MNPPRNDPELRDSPITVRLVPNGHPASPVELTGSGLRRRHWRVNQLWSAGLLLVWAFVTFGVAFWARPLSIDFLGWPFSFWVAAQGALVVYGVLVLVYALVMKRLDDSIQAPATDASGSGHGA